jgi:uncharacterized lipoprotein YmbA
MIERLHNALSGLEHLPPSAQEEAAIYIKALAEVLRRTSGVYVSTKDVSVEEAASVQWQDPFGAWQDLPDTMLDELDQLRHSSQPTPPLELL